MEEVGTPSSAYNLHLYMPSPRSWGHHHHHLLRGLDHKRTIVYMEADRNLVSTVVVPVIGKVTKHTALILVEVSQKCSLTLALVQESHDQQLERKPSSILHRQTTPKKEKEEAAAAEWVVKAFCCCCCCHCRVQARTATETTAHDKTGERGGSEWAQCI